MCAKQRLWTLVLSVALIAFSSGCAGSSNFEKSGRSAPPATSAQSSILPEYKLGFGDVIEVKFFRNSEFNETLTVRPDGRISLHKVGELYVAGMTPAQLDSIVTKTYSEFVIEPDVTVIVREFGGYQVYVLGEVGSPGAIPLRRDMTILQAVAAAGGVRISAQLGSVIILRRGQGQEVEAIKLDLRKSMKAETTADIYANDVFLQPHDIIFLPKTFIANISDFMRQVYSGLLPPLDFYLRATLLYN